MQCSNGKKEEPERSVSERRRREARRRRRRDRAPKARGVSMQLVSVQLGRLRERCKAAKQHLLHFWFENALSGIGYNVCLVKFCHESGRLKRTGTAFRSSKKGPERRSCPI